VRSAQRAPQFVADFSLNICGPIDEYDYDNINGYVKIGGHCTP
jgi:hypothetical protein